MNHIRSRPALFLDRDGVINVDHGYVHQTESIIFIDGIFELVRLANAAGFYVVVVTNQAGIGRGYYTQSEFLALNAWMKTCFTEEGASIDAIYHCPHHPVHGLGPFRCKCACRKPEPGMLLQAMSDLPISSQDSIMIGDKDSDLQAAHRAGVRHLFLLDHGLPQTKSIDIPSNTIIIHRLLDSALTCILGHNNSAFN